MLMSGKVAATTIDEEQLGANIPDFSKLIQVAAQLQSSADSDESFATEEAPYDTALSQLLSQSEYDMDDMDDFETTLGQISSTSQPPRRTPNRTGRR